MDEWRESYHPLVPGSEPDPRLKNPSQSEDSVSRRVENEPETGSG